MGISGTDAALMYAQAGVARFGATRFGYGSAFVFISIDGVQRRDLVRSGSLLITDTLDEVPNTCQFTVSGMVPTVGMEVIITLGSTNNGERIFAGHILKVRQVQVGAAAPVSYHVACIDYTWLLLRRRVFKRYTNQSATAIAQDLMASFATGFTFAGVEPDLETIDEITFTHEDVPTCLTRLAKRIVAAPAYWRADYHKDLHFGTTNDQANPVDLTTAHPSVTDLVYDIDLSQVISRVLIEGKGSTAGAEALVGETELRVVDGVFYNAAGGRVITGSQQLTYTDVAVASEIFSIPSDWLLQVSNTGNIDAFSAAYSPELGIWVFGGTAAIYSSPDAITWTAGTASWTGQPSAVIWVSDLSLFVLLTFSGEVETSPDGLAWTSRTPSAANQWSGVVWADTLGLLVAVSLNGTDRVMTSPDAITWTARTAASALTWGSVAWSSDLTLLVAIAQQSGASTIMTSPDGTTWTSRTSPNSACSWFGVDWSPTLSLWLLGGSAASVGTGAITATSSNGTAWTANAALPTPQATVAQVRWIADETRFVVSTVESPAGARAYYSINATAFTLQTLPITTNWWGVAYGDGVTLIVGSDGSNSRVVGNFALFQSYGILTGIPASGPGSIAYAIAQGDDVHILVTVDDLARQAALASLIGDDGIQEEYVTELERSETECTAVGTAILALRPTTEGKLRYRSRDLRTKSGLTITITIAGTTNISGAFKIQSVIITDFSNAAGLYPTYDVTAAATRFGLDDLLRLARKDRAA